MKNTKNDQMNEMLLRGRSFGLVPILVPKITSNIQGENFWYEKSSNGYSWELNIKKENFTEATLRSEKSLIIAACCSCNDQGEFNVDILNGMRLSLFTSPADASVFNTGSLVPVDWGIISYSDNLTMKIYPVKNDLTFHFALFAGIVPDFNPECYVVN